MEYLFCKSINYILFHFSVSSYKFRFITLLLDLIISFYPLFFYLFPLFIGP